MCIKHCRKVYHRVRKSLFIFFYKLHEGFMWKWLLRRKRYLIIITNCIELLSSDGDKQSLL